MKAGCCSHCTDWLVFSVLNTVIVMITGVVVITKLPQVQFYFSSSEHNNESEEEKYKAKPQRLGALYLTAVT